MPPLVQNSKLLLICTRHGCIPASRLVLINWRGQKILSGQHMVYRLTARPTDRPTVAKQYGPFFKGGIKINTSCIDSALYYFLENNGSWVHVVKYQVLVTSLHLFKSTSILCSILMSFSSPAKTIQMENCWRHKVGSFLQKSALCLSWYQEN